MQLLHHRFKIFPITQPVFPIKNRIWPSRWIDKFFCQNCNFCFSYKFNDTEMSDHDTCRVTLRMFLEFDLINKFQIPYKVRPKTVAGIEGERHPRVLLYSRSFAVGFWACGRTTGQWSTTTGDMPSMSAKLCSLSSKQEKWTSLWMILRWLTTVQ